MKKVQEYFKSLPIEQQTDEVFELIEQMVLDADGDCDESYDSGHSDGYAEGYDRGLEDSVEDEDTKDA
jgi:hypothetical protein